MACGVGTASVWGGSGGLPAVIGGDDQGVAHAGPPQSVAQLVEEPVEEGLQEQRQQRQADGEAAGRLQRKTGGGSPSSQGNFSVKPQRAPYFTTRCEV